MCESGPDNISQWWKLGLESPSALLCLSPANSGTSHRLQPRSLPRVLLSQGWATDGLMVTPLPGDSRASLSLLVISGHSVYSSVPCQTTRSSKHDVQGRSQPDVSASVWSTLPVPVLSSDILPPGSLLRHPYPPLCSHLTLHILP